MVLRIGSSEETIRATGGSSPELFLLAGGEGWEQLSMTYQLLLVCINSKNDVCSSQC